MSKDAFIWAVTPALKFVIILSLTFSVLALASWAIQKLVLCPRYQGKYIFAYCILYCCYNDLECTLQLELKLKLIQACMN